MNKPVEAAPPPEPEVVEPEVVEPAVGEHVVEDFDPDVEGVLGALEAD